jgi:hypothetical protein
VRSAHPASTHRPASGAILAAAPLVGPGSTPVVEGPPWVAHTPAHAHPPARPEAAAAVATRQAPGQRRLPRQPAPGRTGVRDAAAPARPCHRPRPRARDAIPYSVCGARDAIPYSVCGACPPRLCARRDRRSCRRGPRARPALCCFTSLCAPSQVLSRRAGGGRPDRVSGQRASVCWVGCTAGGGSVESGNFGCAWTCGSDGFKTSWLSCRGALQGALTRVS